MPGASIGDLLAPFMRDSERPGSQNSTPTGADNDQSTNLEDVVRGLVK